MWWREACLPSYNQWIKVKVLRWRRNLGRFTFSTDYMTGEDRLLRCKTSSQEATWSEKSTEIVHIGNEIQYFYISSEEGLSYIFIEKIIYGVWLVGCQKVKGKKNLRLFLIFWLAALTWDIEYKKKCRFSGKMISVNLDMFSLSDLLEVVLISLECYNKKYHRLVI